MMNNLPFSHNLSLGFCCLLVSLMISSCIGPEEIPKPDNLIEEENYINLVVEMQHIKTYRDAQPDSVSADSLKNIIYQKYDITEEQFLSSHQYYQKHVEDQLARVDEALRRLEQEEQYIQAHIDSMKKEDEIPTDSLGRPEPVEIREE